VSPASIALSLAAFNLLFALQNGLDLVFLWSGAPLPSDLTLAAYAHRGAYPLIATALLAALFVLVTLRPGTPTGESPLVRRLVYVWIAQNVVLVASTMLRTFDYIDAYSLTRLRIAALVWMALVAVGLVLICVRLWRRKSGPWLINANLAAALLALTACSVIDLGAVAARWNVRHAREVGGAGVRLDLCYLNDLGPAALLPLVELESRPIGPPVPRAGELDPQPDHGPAGHLPGRLARLDLPQCPPPGGGEAPGRGAPPAALLGGHPRLPRPANRNRGL
jgi:hypothetical protein